MRARSTIFTLFVEYIYPERRARVRDLVAMMEALGFSEAAVRAALSRSARRGWVLPQREGRVAFYALSDRVYWQVRQVRRRLYEAPAPWDGRFTLVLPEGPRERGERERFRREMALLGYGSLQSGVYLGAGVDLEATRELLAFYGLPAQLFRGEHLGSREELLRAFPLERAEVHYRRLFPHEAPEGPEEAFRALTRLVHEMRKVLFLDPLLPPELLPPGFLSPGIWRGFLEARAALYGRALPFLKALDLSLPGFSSPVKVTSGT
ncbi:PaaX family transcriptional regulator C-terminal domain-containing protein [Thermus thermamylovorans]|uniref:Repressor in the phenylacetic acid catabolic pathway protein n=1 Tax=Thermus thermamylovorans TaxID=2509362 RepID=A0A4Q9B8Q4_9DEIN|nr:PaaX family transcriptional regulator C-terminal domain-containing protein [Thermus thermamylovorans]TBH21268.1 repressor in the phenylacetic acid catabolic pathway protein [Thermus thermamylovorans]